MGTYAELQLEAVGDATRRGILAALLEGPLAVNEIASGFQISRPAISQHLRILKEAKLVIDRPEGTRRLYELDRAGFASLRDYFDQFWTEALDAFKERVEQNQKKVEQKQRRVEQKNVADTKEDESWRAW